MTRCDEPGCLDVAVEIEGSEKTIKRVKEMLKADPKRTQAESVAKFAHAGQFRDVPDKVAPIDDDRAERVRATFDAYQSTIDPGLQRLLHGYTPSAVARVFAGQGSLGVRNFLMLVDRPPRRRRADPAAQGGHDLRARLRRHRRRGRAARGRARDRPAEGAAGGQRPAAGLDLDRRRAVLRAPVARHEAVAEADREALQARRPRGLRAPVRHDARPRALAHDRGRRHHARSPRASATGRRS